MLALNPRCGEDGTLGDEEQEIIKPAIDELVAKGIQAFGPYAADDFFGSGAYYRFDGVLSMFHDQGQTAFKALSPENGLRLSSGLPLVRTAPAHGTCYQMAGRGQTDATSLRNAIYMAIDVLRNRQAYDEPLQNPLPKLYHEKRDDSEKVRFSQPKPREQFPKRRLRKTKRRQHPRQSEKEISERILHLRTRRAGHHGDPARLPRGVERCGACRLLVPGRCRTMVLPLFLQHGGMVGHHQEPRSLSPLTPRGGH